MLEEYRIKLALEPPKGLLGRISAPFLRRLLRPPQLGFRAENILYALNYLDRQDRRGRVPFGPIAEFGVAEGEGFRQLCLLTHHFCRLRGRETPWLYAFDTFDGMPGSEHPADCGDWAAGDYPGDEQALRAFLETTPVADKTRLVKGLFSESLPEWDGAAPSFLLIDCDYYSSTRDVFEALKERLQPGALVYFDDLGTNFFNPAFGEERLIAEVNDGALGAQYHLHPLWGRLYVWSNADKPVSKRKTVQYRIPLRRTTRLDELL